jgi:hypothetical protein
MPDSKLGGPEIVFALCSLAVAWWTVLDSQRVFRLVSLNSRKNVTRLELVAVRVLAAIVIVGLSSRLLATLLP